MYAPNVTIHCTLARTKERNHYFSYSRKKINLYFPYNIHFISLPYFFFTIHVISVKYTLISNNYKNWRRLKHIYLKYMPINKTNKSVILTSITQRSLGKFTVSPGHSLLVHLHHRNAVDRDSTKMKTSSLTRYSCMHATR